MDSIPHRAHRHRPAPGRIGQRPRCKRFSGVSKHFPTRSNVFLARANVFPTRSNGFLEFQSIFRRVQTFFLRAHTFFPSDQRIFRRDQTFFRRRQRVFCRPRGRHGRREAGWERWEEAFTAETAAGRRGAGREGWCAARPGSPSPSSAGCARREKKISTQRPQRGAEPQESGRGAPPTRDRRAPARPAAHGERRRFQRRDRRGTQRSRRAGEARRPPGIAEPQLGRRWTKRKETLTALPTVPDAA